MKSQAFILRMNPILPGHKVSKKRNPAAEEALRKGHLIIGWAKAEGLLHLDQLKEFQKVIHHAYKHYYDTKPGVATKHAKQAWQFIHGMAKGDLVVVPDGKNFHIGRVAGDPWFDDGEAGVNSAYRRNVEWLEPSVPRASAGPSLQTAMKRRATLLVCNAAAIEEIHEVLGFRPTDPESRERDGIRHGREGEGPNHRKLRCWTMRNPGKVAPDYAGFRTDTEYVLRSADRVDVVFCGPNETVVIEVKSSDSNKDDLERGVFQCIKYRAVMEAMDVCPGAEVTAILVTQAPLPGNLAALARRNDVRHFLAPTLQ